MRADSGDNQDPSDQNDQVIYEAAISLVDTWQQWNSLWTVASAGQLACQT